MDDLYNKILQHLKLKDAQEQPAQAPKVSVDEFLKSISMVESSGGKNTKHKRMEDGIHEGTAAMGQYGLMPNTTVEMANRMVREGNKDPYYEALRKMQATEAEKSLQNDPNRRKEIAEYMANMLLKKYQGDDEKAAYGWNQGHNLSPDDIEKRDYKNADYVKKYRDYLNIRNREK